jgi:hypothetical protein
MEEHMVASDRIQGNSSSTYGSVGSTADYSPLSLEQTAYPNSPDLYYSPLQTINYAQQSQYAASSNYYAPPSSGTYLGTTQAGSPAPSGQGYSSYYAPTSTTQSDWSPANTESREFVGLSGGTYDALSGLPLEPAPLNADLFQFCEPEPENPQ